MAELVAAAVTASLTGDLKRNVGTAVLATKPSAGSAKYLYSVGGVPVTSDEQVARAGSKSWHKGNARIGSVGETAGEPHPRCGCLSAEVRRLLRAARLGLVELRRARVVVALLPRRVWRTPARGRRPRRRGVWRPRCGAQACGTFDHVVAHAPGRFRRRHNGRRGFRVELRRAPQLAAVVPPRLSGPPARQRAAPPELPRRHARQLPLHRRLRRLRGARRRRRRLRLPSSRHGVRRSQKLTPHARAPHARARPTRAPRAGATARPTRACRSQ